MRTSVAEQASEAVVPPIIQDSYIAVRAKSPLKQQQTVHLLLPLHFERPQTEIPAPNKMMPEIVLRLMISFVRVGTPEP